MNLKIYHSTSLKNANKIKKEGFIKAMCYFSENYKHSRYYGSMVSGKVVTFEIEVKDENEFFKGSYFQNKNNITEFKEVKY